MKASRRACGVCGLDGRGHRRAANGRIAWCQASTETMWPVAPLITKAGGRIALCNELGIDPRSLPREISDLQADRWAVRCHLHPDQVWPGWSTSALRYVDDVFVNAGGWRPGWLAAPGPALVDRIAS